MAHYIDKSALEAEIERLDALYHTSKNLTGDLFIQGLFSFIDTLEVKDPYEQYVQHDSIKSGIQAHADTYSFNIESKLFNQLTKEQQKLWRKEIEQACISGGEVGVELARDPRYKENVEVKEVNLNKELSLEDYNSFFKKYPDLSDDWGFDEAWIFAKHFYELGMAASNKTQKL